MKVAIERSGLLEPLRSRLEAEGLEIVHSGNADAIVRAGGDIFNVECGRALGLDISQNHADCYLSRWWENGQWHRNVFVGVGCYGVMNNNQSAAVSVGSSGVVVDGDKAIAFDFNQLNDSLGACDWRSGFVTVHMNSLDKKVREFQTGVPCWGLYNILECVLSIPEFFRDPLNCRLMKSFTQSVVVSRYPWPAAQRTAEPFSIPSPTRSFEKHFWFNQPQRFGGSVVLPETFLGVSTAWSQSLREANYRAVRTAYALQPVVPEVQFRTDSWVGAEDILRRFVGSGAVEVPTGRSGEAALDDSRG